METLSIEFKQRVTARLLQVTDERENVDKRYLDSLGITGKQCVKMRFGKIENLLTDSEWFRLGRKLNINQTERKWNVARTDVFATIEQDVLFCQAHAKAKICVDECGIGKTFTAKYLSKTLKNCFYVDASQGKSMKLFTEILAKAIGIGCMGKMSDIKEDIKCYLRMIEKPIVIIDEAGDLRQKTIQEIKEFWNATEGFCGWYMMGADGLKQIMTTGMKNKQPGFKEIFSRFSDRYTTTVPIGKEDRILFYRKLITDVLSVNMTDKSRLKEILSKCLVQDQHGNISGLRRAESLLILHPVEPEPIDNNEAIAS